ncbi:hypothetical protein D3C87_1404350 [compost metagenome]
MIHAEPEPLHHTGAKVNYQHVGACYQLQERFFTQRTFQVERDPFFVTVVGGEVGAVSAAAKRSEGVAIFRVFYLDHLGAEIRQQCAGQRPRDHRREFDDSHAGQGRGWVLVHFSFHVVATPNAAC